RRRHGSAAVRHLGRDRRRLRGRLTSPARAGVARRRRSYDAGRRSGRSTGPARRSAIEQRIDCDRTSLERKDLAVFSTTAFVDLCERELKLCAVGEGETMIVLSQGEERAEYVDAFMAAAQRLGAKPMNLRLPYASSAAGGEVGVWTVGNTPLAINPA